MNNPGDYATLNSNHLRDGTAAQAARLFGSLRTHPQIVRPVENDPDDTKWPSPHEIWPLSETHFFEEAVSYLLQHFSARSFQRILDPRLSGELQGMPKALVQVKVHMIHGEIELGNTHFNYMHRALIEREMLADTDPDAKRKWRAMGAQYMADGSKVATHLRVTRAVEIADLLPIAQLFALEKNTFLEGEVT